MVRRNLQVLSCIIINNNQLPRYNRQLYYLPNKCIITNIMGYYSIERFNFFISERNAQASTWERIDLPASGLKKNMVEADPVLFDSQEYVDQYKSDLLEADEKRMPLKEFADRFPAYVTSSAYLGNLRQDLEFVIPFLADYKPLSPLLTNFKTPDDIIAIPSDEQYPKYRRCEAANYINKYLELMIQANTEGSEKDKLHSLLGKNYFNYIDSAKVLKQQKAAFTLVWPYLNENIFKVPDIIPGGYKNKRTPTGS